MSKQQFSQWFTNGEKPWESGAYMVRCKNSRFYAHWDVDFGWGGGSRTPMTAYEDRGCGADPNFYNAGGNSWRGLAHPPKAKP